MTNEGGLLEAYSGLWGFGAWRLRGPEALASGVVWSRKIYDEDSLNLKQFFSLQLLNKEVICSQITIF